MLREDGILYDDGTASRLATDRYLMTTTTHNAAGVLAHMEFHHQCVWPGLDVQFCSVTEQWAGLAVAGPRSRELLSRVLPQISLDNDAFPYMAAGEFTFRGMPLRLFRISFSGELGYEINVPAGYARAFADHLMEVGAAFDITPYGSEALDVMRIEKGHVTAKELNGQTTPHDLGLGRMVSHKKDYIGRFLSGRPGMIDANRQRIVGLIPERTGAGGPFEPSAHLVTRAQAACEAGQNECLWLRGIVPASWTIHPLPEAPTRHTVGPEDALANGSTLYLDGSGTHGNDVRKRRCGWAVVAIDQVLYDNLPEQLAQRA